MRVLIIGSDTPVGLALEHYFAQREREFVSLPRAECRWKSERRAKKSLRRADCDIAIDTRIQAAVDGGVRIHDVDVDRCRWLARASQTIKRPYMLLSSAAVYSGALQRAYSEEDHPDNDSGLGQLILAAEAAVSDHCERHVLLRTGPLFSPHGLNVVTHMLDRLHAGDTLSLGRSREGCPVSTDDAARVVCGMVDQFSCGLDAWGIYHYCSSDISNCYEFAEVLLAAASQYEEFPEDGGQLREIPDDVAY